MPNPKRRHSTRRTANRRAHDFLTATGLSECPNCHEKKLPHVRCPKCKQYKGHVYGEVKEEK
jgi:large subunit ribosomal protein L32